MKQYLDLLQNILDNGREKESGRANMPNTIGISHGTISMDLSEGFPLLTTKKMFWKGIVHELLWFLRGETNIKYLVDNKVNIWNSDAFRWYLKYDKEFNAYGTPPLTMEQFIETIKTSACSMPWFDNSEYKLGDLGKVYGYQWRNKGGTFDQVADVINGLKTNPYSRYHIIDGWDKESFKEAALPVCHLYYQFTVRPMTISEREELYIKLNNIADDDHPFPNHSDADVEAKLNEWGVPKFFLDLNMLQRSNDFALGNPYNFASMSLLLMIVAKTCNMIPGVAYWTGCDVHVYLPHIETLKEQLKREPRELPQMKINKKLDSLEDILSLTIDDFELLNYNPHPALKFELFVGLSNKK